MFKINGVEFEFNYYNVNDLKAFESSYEYTDKKIKESEEKLNSQNEIQASEFIGEICEIIMDFFDDVLGEGTSSKILNDPENIDECIQAFIDFKIELLKQKKEHFLKMKIKNEQIQKLESEIEEIKNDTITLKDEETSLNREQRRAKRKNYKN